MVDIWTLDRAAALCLFVLYPLRQQKISRLREISRSGRVGGQQQNSARCATGSPHDGLPRIEVSPE
jgi:hypothetical protein